MASPTAATSAAPKLQLLYREASPVACLYVAHLAKKAVTLETSVDQSLTGREVVARLVPPKQQKHEEAAVSDVKGLDSEVAAAIAKAVPLLAQNLLPSSAPHDEILYWLEFATALGNAKQGAIKFCSSLDDHLKCRTYLVGHKLTIADVAVFAGVFETLGGGNLDAEFAALTPLVHFRRWMKLIKPTIPIPPKILKSLANAYPGHLGKVTAAAAVPLASASKATAKAASKDSNAASVNLYEGKLPNAVPGAVVTRFPPEPSGYLHIGHAKAALLNDYYAHFYNGRLLLRFDDTNPAKEKMEFEQSIIGDLDLLGVKPDGPVTHTSDYFDAMQDICERLLRDGRFYCDDTPLEIMRAERGDGTVSKCRDLSVEENLRRWEEMKKGSAEGAANCVRAKIDMSSKNKCLRDPVMYRVILDPPHHIHGTKYKAYPMYDFACPVVDSIEGVTHAMRTNEYADRIPQYAWVQSAAGLRPVIIYEFSRLNFVHTVLSKRKLQWLVDTGVVSGWDDPRFPTVRGVRRRGLTVQALREFLFEQGPSKNANLMEWDKLWTKNKQIIDPVVPRFMGVDKAGGVVVHISNGPAEVELRDRPLHPKNAKVGVTKTLYGPTILLEPEDAEASTEGEEVTLMRWGNAFIRKVHRDAANDKVVRLDVELNLPGDVKTTARKLHWVAVNDSKDEQLKPVSVVLREYDNLIVKAKPEENDTMEDLVNRDSVFESVVLCERGIEKLEVNGMCQLERKGYFRVDHKADEGGLVLIKIPDGKASKPAATAPPTPAKSS